MAEIQGIRLYIIDEHGHFIDFYNVAHKHLSQIHSKDSRFVMHEFPENFSNPRWNGKKWIDMAKPWYKRIFRNG